MIFGLGELLWLLILMGPLLFLQNRLHYEAQAILFLLTHRTDITAILFFILFFPGILLHEISHLIMAFLLRVRVGSFSLLPRVIEPSEKGKPSHLQLGRVETSSTDIFRDAFIGTAPLITGGLLITYGGMIQLHLDQVWENMVKGDFNKIFQDITSLYMQPDFWVWFYLILVVSSTMLPSASDRRAWLPIGLIFISLITISILAGAGPWMISHLAPILVQAFQALTIVVGISVSVHLILITPLYLLRRLLTRLTGMQVG
jgi:hypothetical protein